MNNYPIGCQNMAWPKGYLVTLWLDKLFHALLDSYAPQTKRGGGFRSLSGSYCFMYIYLYIPWYLLHVVGTENMV